MRVTRRVEVQHFALDGILRKCEVEDDGYTSCVSRRSRMSNRLMLAGCSFWCHRGLHANLDCRERPAGIAIAYLSQKRHGIIRNRDRYFAQAAFGIGQSPCNECADILAT